jgi:hypothetical protein
MPSWDNQKSQMKSMSVMLQNSFSLSNLSFNVDNGEGWYGGSGDGGILVVS